MKIDNGRNISSDVVKSDSLNDTSLSSVTTVKIKDEAISNSKTSADIFSKSSATKNLQNLTSKLETSSDVRQDKVKELKKLIKDGKYFVKAQDLAEKLVRTAIERSKI